MEEFELFKGKTLSNLFEDIYINQLNKKVKISSYIEEIQKTVRPNNAGDVAVIGPIVKDLIDTSVRNDEQLIKLATIAQRIMLSLNKSESDSGFLTDAEKKQLLQQLDENLDTLKSEVDGDIEKAQKELTKIKQTK
jgi:hypothetical protein